MPAWIENLKTLIPLLTLVAVGAGFYYTTNHRLDHLEDVVSKLKEEVSEIKTTNTHLIRDNNNLKEDVVKLRKNLSRKQDKRK